MIRTAVILAAGLGSRLKALTSDKPKGLMEIDGLPLVEHSVRKLIAVGVQRVFIVTGYLRERYEQWAETYPEVTCIVNPAYADTGSMGSLACVKDEVNGPFLLLESDLYYDRWGLDMIQKSPAGDVVLASGFTASGDEVYIELREGGLLHRVSKDRSQLSGIDAELVGISKLSMQAFTRMCDYYEDQANRMMDYEHVMAAISDRIEFQVLRLDPFWWCEIDTAEHLERALRLIVPQVQLRESARAVRRNVLLNPGPATTTDTVKYAQVVPDICPRETEFGNIMAEIAVRLTEVVADPLHYSTVLFGGSGTAAVEAIISSVIASDDKVLILNNGAYGARMCEIASAYGIDHVDFGSSATEEPDYIELERRLHEDRSITHVAVVHNETTTGLLNDIERIGRICNRYGAEFIVDAMSSYAALPICMATMNIDYLAASSNKNLQGMAGVSFVVSRNELLEQSSKTPRSYYLNLYQQHAYFKKTGQMRFTPPVQTLYALKQALVEHAAETTVGKYRRYTACWRILQEGLATLGLTTLVADKCHSRIITSVVEPDHEGYSFDAMHDELYRQGFTIYPGKLNGSKTFRIANIGDITPDDMHAFLCALTAYLKKVGYVQ